MSHAAGFDLDGDDDDEAVIRAWSAATGRDMEAEIATVRLQDEQELLTLQALLTEENPKETTSSEGDDDVPF